MWSWASIQITRQSAGISRHAVFPRRDERNPWSHQSDMIYATACRQPQERHFGNTCAPIPGCLFRLPVASMELQLILGGSLGGCRPRTQLGGTAADHLICISGHILSSDHLPPR